MCIRDREVIVQTMQCLEDKITCNEHINDNLEQQAQSYFQELFVDNADPEWAIGDVYKRQEQKKLAAEINKIGVNINTVCRRINSTGRFLSLIPI